MNSVVMKRRLAIGYLLCDWLSAVLAWTSFFIFRKTVIEGESTAETFTFFNDPNFWYGVAVVPLCWLLLYFVQGTYRNVLHKARLKELLQTAFAAIVGTIVLFFALIIDDDIRNYRNYYVSFLFLLFVHFLVTYTMRLILTSRTVHKVHSRQIGFPTVMIGAGKLAYKTYLDLEHQETYSGERFVGFVKIGAEAVDPNMSVVMPDLGGLDNLREIVGQHDVEEVIIALDENSREQIGTIMQTTNECGDLTIRITPDARDLMIGSVKVNSIFHSPLITINNRLMEEWQYSIKRLFDIVASLLAMLLLSPVYLVTAVIIKTTSSGPVFYAQERVGYRGKPFKMHKFRSMYIDAEANGPALASDNDPRITPFGRFMRKVRLDEIPQFYNVLKGTMSIVGPRPERQFYIDQIVARSPEYLLLQRVKPGITSWGQVKYGYAENIDEMLERMRYDLLYLENMSLATDVKIMLYTVLIIIQGRGK